MEYPMADIAVVVAFLCLGWWLESINGKHGFIDELLAPLPMGLGGSGIMLLFERTWA